MNQPNFFIIGAMKAGTTSLYRYLENHPEVCMSSKKEPHFFMFKNKDMDYNGIGDLENTSRMIVTNKADYLNLFDQSRPYHSIGEASAMYLYDAQVASEIKSNYPSAKIIIMLRNPVNRAFSSYMHLIRDGREKLDFKSSLEAEKGRIENNWSPIWHYFQAGLYYEQVSTYLNDFGENQVKIVLFEDFKEDTKESVKSILSFLDVTNDVNLEVSEIHNASGKPRSMLVHKLLRYPHPFKTKLFAFLPQTTKDKLRTKLMRKNLKRDIRIPHTLGKELEAKYESDVIRLGELIGVDLIKKWRFN